jgi:hypothetical protein
MHRLGKMAFLSTHNQPAQRQRTPVIDHTQHQGDAATSDDTAIHHKLERLLGQCLQQVLCDGQKPAIDSLAVVFEEAAKAINETFLFGAMTGRVVSDDGQVGVLATTQTADQGDQGIEVLFLMPTGARLVKLHNTLFYGTIPAIRVAHGASPDWQRSYARRSIPEVTRIEF